MTETPPYGRWPKWGIWLAILSICGLRFFYLTADFPNFSRWMIDQAKYTDEGWWASGAVLHHLLGRWVLPGDYNPVVALPVFPLLLDALFDFTGVSIVAARALDVLASVVTLGLVYLLVRRYSTDMAATLATLLLAASPFAYVFSRLAILDTLVVFEFCLLLLVASYASTVRWATICLLALLIPVTVLTKTTAAFLLPAVLWLAWAAMKTKVRHRLVAATLVALVSGSLFKVYASWVTRHGFGLDYQYFFSVNRQPGIAWKESWGTLSQILKDGMWIDRILFPLGLVLLMLSLLWLRRLWTNPLFTASWIAIGGQAVFLFLRQDDYPPRYFLVMLVPLILIVALAAEELRRRQRTAHLLMMTTLAIVLVVNLSQIFAMVYHRTFQFYDAATSIGRIVKGDSARNPMICGVSAGEIFLVTGVPSISDVYGTQELSEKLLLYRPGWFLAWNGIDPEMRPALSRFRVEEVATYPVFDDEDRNHLILYRMDFRVQ